MKGRTPLLADLAALAASLIFVGLGASAQSTGDAWAGIKLKLNGWTNLDGSRMHDDLGHEMLGFYQLPLIRRPGALPLIRVRFEFSFPTHANWAPEKPFRSETNLYEIDCTRGRQRLVQLDIYADNNLVGTPEATLKRPGDWLHQTYFSQGDLAQSIQKAACGTQ
ncbi:MAG: surface-adhesin E family protein [Caulobacterales bacterium]